MSETVSKTDDFEESLHQLKVAKHVIQLLEKMRLCLNDFNQRCVCYQTLDIKEQFREYDNQYKKFMESIAHKSDEESEPFLDIGPEISHPFEYQSTHTSNTQRSEPILKTYSRKHMEVSNDPIDVHIKQEVFDPDYGNPNYDSLEEPQNYDQSNQIEAIEHGQSDRNEFVVTEVGQNQSLLRGIQKNRMFC